MTLNQYAYKKNYTKEEYLKLKEFVAIETSNILMYIKENFRNNNGVYYKINEINPLNKITEDLKMLIINELKKLEVEFIENYEYFRY